MILKWILAFMAPFLGALWVTPWVIRFANRIGATDQPDARKVHTVPMPRIGGVAIVLSFLVAGGVLWMLFPDLFESIRNHSNKAWVIAGSFLMLFLLGLRDDLHPLSPGVKFGVQFLLSSMLYWSGFQLSNLHPSMGSGILEIQGVDYLLTVIWMVGITNAFNLIDGLDGLATGVATIAILSVGALSWMSGQLFLVTVSLMLAGSMVGFLRYNFHPATIFLGDSGSLVIGFSMALLALESAAAITSGVATLVPVLILMLPIADTSVAMVRRWLGTFLDTSMAERGSMLRRLHRMVSPDRAHIHHRLLSMGFGHRGSVLVLYGVATISSLSAFLLIQLTDARQSMVVIILLALLMGSAIHRLNYREISIFSNGLLKNKVEQWRKHRHRLAGVLDAGVALLAYGMTFGWFTAVASPDALNLARPGVAIPVILIQLILFWGTGLYRERMVPFSIGSLIHCLASVIHAAGFATLYLIFQGHLSLSGGLQFFFLDFYLLATSILGYRIAYEALRFWVQRKRESGVSVVIYGAGEAGVQVLNRLLDSDSSYNVLGFLDDDPDMEGEVLCGYPVFGGHWELSKPHLSSRVHLLVLSGDEFKRENLLRVLKMASSHGIAVKKFDARFEDYPGVPVAPEEMRSEKGRPNPEFAEVFVPVLPGEHAEP